VTSDLGSEDRAENGGAMKKPGSGRLLRRLGTRMP
jgi:hypothetical protein